jgi:putative endonuclease
VRNAIAREKELKLFTRAQKTALIEKVNPTWDDLYSRLIAFGEADPLRG